MVITKTPFRMSFFGGGTDMKEFYEKFGGSILSTTFDKYCYVTVRNLPRFFKYANELVYSRIERVNDIDEIEHPLIRNCMKYMNLENLRLTYDADLPARSGLGTSSSFAVGILQNFHAMKGEMADKKKLADEAIYVERVLCQEAGGIQDQIAASFGGLNHISIHQDGSYVVAPVIISNERKAALNDNLMLFFTGFSHFSAKVQTEVKKDMKAKEAQLLEMKSLVDEAISILASKGDLNDFGRLLHHTWELKRGISSGISTDSIDELYKRGRAAGALGGKLLGSGGGGFLLFYVEKDKRAFVRNALSDLMYVPFRFENGGTQVIYYNAQDKD
jgi:D-glycero-alpha-D-manno-heptose-7-phosphate kinase